MGVFKARLFTGLLGYGLIVGAGVAAVLHYLQQSIDWNWFAGAFVFFIAIEVLILHIVESNSHSKDQKKLVNIYMLTKVIKIVSSLFFILTYYLIERDHNLKTFIILCVAFYLLFLIAELFIFSKIEKHIKSSNGNE